MTNFDKLKGQSAELIEKVGGATVPKTESRIYEPLPITKSSASDFVYALQVDGSSLGKQYKSDGTRVDYALGKGTTTIRVRLVETPITLDKLYDAHKNGECLINGTLSPEGKSKIRPDGGFAFTNRRHKADPERHAPDFAKQTDRRLVNFDVDSNEMPDTWQGKPLKVGSTLAAEWVVREYIPRFAPFLKYSEVAICWTASALMKHDKSNDTWSHDPDSKNIKCHVSYFADRHMSEEHQLGFVDAVNAEHGSIFDRTTMLTVQPCYLMVNWKGLDDVIENRYEYFPGGQADWSEAIEIADKFIAKKPKHDYDDPTNTDFKDTPLFKLLIEPLDLEYWYGPFESRSGGPVPEDNVKWSLNCLNHNSKSGKTLSIFKNSWISHCAVCGGKRPDVYKAQVEDKTLDEVFAEACKKLGRNVEDVRNDIISIEKELDPYEIIVEGAATITKLDTFNIAMKCAIQLPDDFDDVAEETIIRAYLAFRNAARNEKELADLIEAWGFDVSDYLDEPDNIRCGLVQLMELIRAAFSKDDADAFRLGVGRHRGIFQTRDLTEQQIIDHGIEWIKRYPVEEARVMQDTKIDEVLATHTTGGENWMKLAGYSSMPWKEVEEDVAEAVKQIDLLLSPDAGTGKTFSGLKKLGHKSMDEKLKVLFVSGSTHLNMQSERDLDNLFNHFGLNSQRVEGKHGKHKLCINPTAIQANSMGITDLGKFCKTTEMVQGVSDQRNGLILGDTTFVSEGEGEFEHIMKSRSVENWFISMPEEDRLYSSEVEPKDMELVTELDRSGLKVGQYMPRREYLKHKWEPVKKFCPFYDECGYQNQFNWKQSIRNGAFRLADHHHVMNAQGPFIGHEKDGFIPDIIFIDEMIDFNNFQIFEKDNFWQNGKGKKDYRELLEILDTFYCTDLTPRQKKSRVMEIIEEHEVVLRELAKEFKEDPPLVGGMSESEVKKAINKFKRNRGKVLNFAYNCMRLLDYVNAQPEEVGGIETRHYPIELNTETDEIVFVWLHHLDPIYDKSQIICADATGNLLYWRTLTGRWEMEQLSIPVLPQPGAVRIATIGKENTKNQLTDDISDIMKMKEMQDDTTQRASISYKDVDDDFRDTGKFIENGVKHFGYCRGDNDFENVQQLSVNGRHDIGPAAFLWASAMNAGGIGEISPEWIYVAPPIRMSDGKTCKIGAPRKLYLDPRLELAHIVWAESETIQALARNRDTNQVTNTFLNSSAVPPHWYPDIVRTNQFAVHQLRNEKVQLALDRDWKKQSDIMKDFMANVGWLPKNVRTINKMIRLGYTYINSDIDLIVAEQITDGIGYECTLPSTKNYRDSMEIWVISKDQEQLLLNERNN